MNRVWYAVDCAIDQSPALARLRAAMGETADSYYYRACAFCRLYRRTGQLAAVWQDVAAFVRWPECNHAEMRDTFIACGLVTGVSHLLASWQGTNGWILERAEKARLRTERNRRAARIGARKRREKQRAGGQVRRK